MFVLNISAWRLHPCKPNFHSPCMNVALVRGRTTTQNRKSVTARLTTNTFGVVLRDFSFQTAINTNAFPQAPSTIREQATRISMVTCRESRGLRENGAFVVSFILRHSGRSAETVLLSSIPGKPKVESQWRTSSTSLKGPYLSHGKYNTF